MLMSEAVFSFHEYQASKQQSQGTIREYKKDLAHFSASLANMDVLNLTDVTSTMIIEYLNSLMNTGIKASTRNRKMNSLRSFFKYCHKQAWLPTNLTLYVERLPEEKVARTILTKQEVQQLLQAIEHPLVRTVVLTLYLTGLRISECLSLRGKDINLVDDYLIVRHGKGNKERKIPLHLELKRIYFEQAIERDSLVFCTKRSGQLSASYVNRLLKEATLKLGWNKHVTCHVLRHSFASALLNEKVNILTVQQFLGHANLKTTSGYVHLFADESQAAIQTLAI